MKKILLGLVLLGFLERIRAEEFFEKEVPVEEVEASGDDVGFEALDDHEGSEDAEIYDSYAEGVVVEEEEGATDDTSDSLDAEGAGDSEYSEDAGIYDSYAEGVAVEEEEGVAVEEGEGVAGEGSEDSEVAGGYEGSVGENVVAEDGDASGDSLGSRGIEGSEGFEDSGSHDFVEEEFSEQDIDFGGLEDW